MKTKEALTFLTVRKLKTREALTFSLVFTAATTKRRAEPGGRHFPKNSLPTEISPSRAHTQLRIARTNETKRFPGEGLTNADNTPQPPIYIYIYDPGYFVLLPMIMWTSTMQS